MTEAEWLACTEPREMLNFLSDKESDRKLRLFAVACCQCSRQLLLNKDHREALELATRFADGQETEDALQQALRRADDVARRLYSGKSEREIRRWAEATAVANAVAVVTPGYTMACYAADAAWMIHRASHQNPNERLAGLLRDICRNPFSRWPEWRTIRPLLGNFRPPTTELSWLTPAARGLAAGIYADRAFDRLPTLADVIEEVVCTNQEILNHCRRPGEHVRGCWVVDLVLGKG